MKRPTPALALLACLATLVLGGCNVVGPLVYLLKGPDKIKRVHALDKERTTVVLIDDRANRVPRRALRILIGEVAEKTLLQQRVVKEMISSQSALIAAGSDRGGKPLSVAEIGAAVDADVVIYATVDSFSISPDGATVFPTSAMRVRVIDVPGDTRIWPEDPDGFKLITSLTAKTQSMPSSTTARYQIEDDLARRAGLELAQLFYSHAQNHGTKVPE